MSEIGLLTANGHTGTWAHRHTGNPRAHGHTGTQPDHGRTRAHGQWTGTRAPGHGHTVNPRARGHRTQRNSGNMTEKQHCSGITASPHKGIYGIDGAKTAHVEINLRSRQKAARKQHDKDSDMPSTADGAETPHVEINITSRHHRQRNKAACKQQGNHMVMQQEGTLNKHQGLLRRATSS